MRRTVSGMGCGFWSWILVLMGVGVPGVVGFETENVILITMDGVRGQELFRGVDDVVLEEFAKKKEAEATTIRKRFWDVDPEVSRAKIMPFFWNHWMAREGSVMGNRWKGSEMLLSNQLRFSYPGYSEILVGKAYDEVITSNAKIQNPNATVLEFIQNQLGREHARVGVFASWEVMNFIAMQQAGALFANSGFQAYDSPDPLLSELSAAQFQTTTPWDSVRHDFYTFRFAMDYLKREQPRALFLSVGETDDWAHDARYDRVLQMMHQTDGYFRELWTFLQGHEQYRGKTTILVGTDHGRGTNQFNWISHNARLEGARYTWLAIISPDLEKRGEWVETETVYQSQVAATMARFLDLDYSQAKPDAGPVIDGVFESK